MIEKYHASPKICMKKYHFDISPVDMCRNSGIFGRLAGRGACNPADAGRAFGKTAGHWYSLKNKETPGRERCNAVAGRVFLFLGEYQRKTCIAAVSRNQNW